MELNKDAVQERISLKRFYVENVIQTKGNGAKQKLFERIQSLLGRIHSFLEYADHKEKFFVLRFEDHVGKYHTDTNFQKKATAFENLEKYAYNLLTARWKKTYRVIKENTAFYKCKIEPHLANVDVIWRQMGYRREVASWVLSTDISSSDLAELGVDLLIASVECTFVKKLYDKVHRFDFGDPAELALDARINWKGTVDECYLWLSFKVQSQITDEKKAVADAMGSSAANLVYYDDDDDLYSPGPEAVSRKGPLTQDEHIEASLIAVLSEQAGISEKKPNSDRMAPLPVAIHVPPPPERTDASYRYLTEPTYQSKMSAQDDNTHNALRPVLRTVPRQSSGSSGYSSLQYYPSNVSDSRDSNQTDLKPRKLSSPDEAFTPYENLPRRHDMKPKPSLHKAQPSGNYGRSGSSEPVPSAHTEQSAHRYEIDTRKVDTSKKSEKSHRSEVKVPAKSSNISSAPRGTQSKPPLIFSSINDWTCVTCLHFNRGTAAKCNSCKQPNPSTLLGRSSSSSITSGSYQARDEAKKTTPTDKSKGAGTQSSESKRKLNMWECPHCTTINETVDKICRVCYKSKDFSNPENKPQKEGKVCPKCTSFNERWAKKCKNCKALLSCETSV